MEKCPYFIWRQWFSTLQDALSLEIQEMKQVGDDIKIVAHARSEVMECLQEL